jgi:hypothetical protein
MDSTGQNNNVPARLKELESQLCKLAMEWRSTKEDRQKIKEKYHSTMQLMFSLDWDDILDIDCELPNDDMPQEYLDRHPYVPTSGSWPDSWSKKE